MTESPIERLQIQQVAPKLTPTFQAGSLRSLSADSTKPPRSVGVVMSGPLFLGTLSVFGTIRSDVPLSTRMAIENTEAHRSAFLLDGHKYSAEWSSRKAPNVGLSICAFLFEDHKNSVCLFGIGPRRSSSSAPGLKQTLSRLRTKQGSRSGGLRKVEIESEAAFSRGEVSWCGGSRRR